MSFSIKVAMTYSPTNICSTIGAVGLNFSVRDGKRWIPDAINRLNKCKKALTGVQNKDYFSRHSKETIDFVCILKNAEQSCEVCFKAHAAGKYPVRKQKLSGN